MSYSAPGYEPTGLQATLLLAAASDLISTHDAMGVVEFASPASESLLGYLPEEMIGRSAYEFVHPDDVPIVQRVFAGLLPRNGADRAMTTYRCLRRDGSVCWVEGHARALRDPRTGRVEEVHLVSRDVTARIQAEQQLREQHALLEALFAHSPAGVMLLRARRVPGGPVTDFEFLRINDQARAMMSQQAPAPLPGHTMLEQYPWMATSALFAGYCQTVGGREPLDVRLPNSVAAPGVSYRVVAVPLPQELLAVSFLELNAPAGVAVATG